MHQPTKTERYFPIRSRGAPDAAPSPMTQPDTNDPRTDPITGRRAPPLLRQMKYWAGQYGPECISVLAGIMRNPAHPAAVRAACANSLLDRAFGKPTQAVELSGRGGGPLQTQDLSARTDLSGLTDEELDALDGLLSKAAARGTSRAAEADAQRETPHAIGPQRH